MDQRFVKSKARFTKSSENMQIPGSYSWFKKKCVAFNNHARVVGFI